MKDDCFHSKLVLPISWRKEIQGRLFNEKEKGGNGLQRFRIQDWRKSKKQPLRLGVAISQEPLKELDVQ